MRGVARVVQHTGRGHPCFIDASLALVRRLARRCLIKALLDGRG